ncbi:MAG: response regulator [Deltaproteobacteria bacterium]|nr:response regulator [Deltaproteobacteria bacterium]
MHKGTLLVVDDEESVRRLLKEFFESLGFEVVTADGGEDALQKFIPGKFDSVISDLFMPNINGIEFLKKIRQRDAKVMFLMITGYPSLESAVEAMKEGAYDYITKPFTFDDIKIKLERALHARRLEQSLKKINGVMWGLIISIPIWLILGIALGLVWRWI